MKTIISGAVLALALAFTGSYTGTAQEPTTCATPEPSIVQHFDGTGGLVTDPFVLPKGVYIVRATSEGTGSISVDAFDPSGFSGHVLVVEPGSVKEATFEVDEETKTLFRITQYEPGPWTIDIEPAF